MDVSTLPPIPAAAVSQSLSLTGRVGSRAREEADARQVGSGDEDYTVEWGAIAGSLRAGYHLAPTVISGAQGFRPGSRCTVSSCFG